MRKDLEEFVKETFEGNNEIKFFISERGNQRIEIQDLGTKEIWQTLEAVEPVEDMDNFDEISSILIFNIIKFMTEE